jgi:hypothetical protein
MVGMMQRQLKTHAFLCAHTYILKSLGKMHFIERIKSNDSNDPWPTMTHTGSSGKLHVIQVGEQALPAVFVLV